MNSGASAVPNHHCAICLDDFENPKRLECGHSFCTACIDSWFERYQKKCPSCGKFYGPMQGNQPPGKRTTRLLNVSLPGHEGFQTIEITYVINSGIQTNQHPNPGKPFMGTARTAYLPANKEGYEVCELLRIAFEAGLIFTVGQSITTGANNVVVWNDIHHKTSYTGPYGYPDETYLSRIKEELAAKGIVMNQS